MRLLAAVIAATALTGCATPFQKSQAPNLDKPTALATLGIQLDAIRDELATAELCIADPRTTPTELGGVITQLGCRQDIVETTKTSSDIQPSSEIRLFGVKRSGRAPGEDLLVEPYDNDNINAYVRLRMSQVDGLCGLFFDGLSQVKNQTGYGRDLFNIASEFATVALGVSGSPAEQLAVLSGIQLSVNDTLDATERAMMLSPDPHKIFLLVSQTQDAVVRPAGRTFADAENYIRDYARPCTFLGIQAVIDKALSQEIERNSTGRQEDVNAALDEVTKAVNAVADPDISTLAGQVLPLYWLFVLAPAEGSPEQAHALTLLPANVRSAVTTALADIGKRAEIQAILQGLDANAPVVRQSADAARQNLLNEQKQIAEQQRRLTEQQQRLTELRADAARQQAAAQAATAEAALVAARTREIEAKALADAQAAQRELDPQAASERPTAGEQGPVEGEAARQSPQL